MGKNPTHFNKVSAIEGYYVGAKGQERLVVGMGLSEPGNQFFVDSATGADSNNGKGWATALATLDAAFGKCTANNGDIVWVAPGHSETWSTTGTKVTADVAGVRVIGVGFGADRPTFTFSHTGATWSVTAASVVFDNLLFVTGVDSVTTIATISGDDCIMGHPDGYGVEVRDTTDVEVIDAFTVTGDRFKANVNHHGYTGGNANLRTFKMNGVADAEIYVIALGKAGTAVVNFVTNPCTNIRVKGYFLVEGTTNLSKNVVDTEGNGTWEVEGFDLGAGLSFSGGSGAAVTGSDVSAVSTKVDSVGTQAGSLGTQATSVGTLTTSVGTLTTSVGTQATSVGTQVTSVGTLTTSVGTQATSIGTQATSVGTLVTSVGTLAGSAATTTSATSVGTLVTSVGTLTTSVGTVVGSAASTTNATSVGTLVTSVGTLAGSAATTTNATSVGTLVTSVGTLAGSAATTTNATSVGTLVTSVGTLAGSAATTTSATSVGTLVTSVGTQTTSVGTQVGSVGTLTTSVGTQATSIGTQAGSVGTQVTSVGTLTTSVGTQLTTGLANLGGSLARKTITYTGAVSYTAFTVTGCAAVKVIGYITTALTNHADTTSVGTATSAAGLIAATAGTAMQTVNQVWVDTGPSKFETYPTGYFVLGDGEDVAVTSTANLAGGVVELYCIYIPLSADGVVAPA